MFDTRRSILEYLEGRQSAHIAEVARAIMRSRSTTAGHLRALERSGVISSRRVGRRRFYGFAPRDLSAVAGATARLVAATVIEHPGSTALELAALARVSRRVAHHHAARLEAARFVLAVGEPMRYFATPELESSTGRGPKTSGEADVWLAGPR